MNSNHRKITKSLSTRDNKTYCSMSNAMRKTFLKSRGTPSLQGRKRGQSHLQKRELDNPCHYLMNIVGCRISHEWKNGNEPVTQWNATVLDQVPTIPCIYLVKYDGIDCVCGVELHNDKRISNLKILPNVIRLPKVRDTAFASLIVGKAVEHTFEDKDGCKEKWMGVVLAQVPFMESWFYITYENDPVLYVYQLMDDYIDGNLRILPGYPNVEMKSEGGRDFFTGKYCEYISRNGTKKKGRIIYQILAKPSVYFIKCDNETLIYVYDLVEKAC